jgi:nucleolar protein 56
MGHTIYSNIIGSFAFLDKKLVEERLSKGADMAKNSALLEKQGQIDAEKQLLGKFSGADVVGKKNAPPSWVLDFFNQPKYLEKMQKAAMLITKRKIAGSLNPEYLIVQAVQNIAEIDKVVNNIGKRLREWYELYNPEFSKSIESHEKFAELIQKKSRKELLKEIDCSEDESMGAEITKKDLEPMMNLAAEISSLFALRGKQEKYVEKSMKELLPNVTAVCGGMIGAKLLAVAGTLKKMALFPASTIQLLGAEKALFRHIKTGAKPPKFGVIINHPIVAKAKQSEKGKAARMLADKISIAAKIDFFKGEFRGDVLRKEVEKRFG